MTKENKAGNYPKEIQNMGDVLNAIGTLEDAAFPGIVYYPEKSLNKDEPVDEHRVWIEFDCLDDLDCLLRILTDPKKVPLLLYRRIIPSVNDRYPKDAWGYTLEPRTTDDLHPKNPYPKGILFYQVSVDLPVTDLPAVLDILQEHNARAEHRRPPAPTKEEPTK